MAARWDWAEDAVRLSAALVVHPIPFNATADAMPEWWQILSSLGPLAVLLAAIITGVIGWRNLRHAQLALEQKITADRESLEQRSLSDQKAQWWSRVQWALESTRGGGLG